MTRARHLVIRGVCVIAALWFALPVSAQTPMPMSSMAWTHGTTLNVFAGVGSASSEAGPLAGGAVGWEITPRVAVEGAGMWLDRLHGAKAFGADLTGQIRLLPPHPVVPFLEAGIGLYRATFDLTQDAALPDFYAQRLSSNGVATTATFTDTSFILGGGVDVFVTRHLAIRPELRGLLVRDHGQHYPVTMFVMRLGYHFEEHPIGAAPKPAP